MRLLGIGEEEEADLDRRGFLKMLGGVAVVAAAPTYVFAPSRGWTPTKVEPIYQFGFTGFKEMNSVTTDWIVPMLTDNVFKPSPLFSKLKVKDLRGISQWK